jgi:hypothetical protein
VISILLTGGTLGVTAADVLDWDTRNGRVHADITGWNLEKLLEHVTTHTGWEIFLEPGAEHTVSTRFDDFTTGEALRSLLGPLNFAVVPQAEGPARLYVFQTSRSQATQRVEAPSPEEPLPEKSGVISNELVIAVKPGTNIEELARQLDAKITGRIDELGIYRLTFEDETSARAAMDALRENPDVRSVEFNLVVPTPPAAATTGPARGPRPASSTPTSSSSSAQASRSRFSEGRTAIGSALALFPDPGRLAAQRPEVVELGATHPAAAHHLDGRDGRTVQGEEPLDADTGGDLPHGEHLADPTAPPGDYQTLERLEPLLVALANADHDADGVTGVECRNVRAQALTGHLCQPFHGRTSAPMCALNLVYCTADCHPRPR